MSSRRTNRALPLFLAKFKIKDKRFLKIENLLGLIVTTEEYKKPAGPGQCHKCQTFGHSQANCHAQEKCMKCGEEHVTKD